MGLFGWVGFKTSEASLEPPEQIQQASHHPPQPHKKVLPDTQRLITLPIESWERMSE